MRLAIADPGLATPIGHHFDHAVLLCRALVRSGVEVDVHGFVQPMDGVAQALARAGASYVPAFPVYAYAKPATADSDEAWRLHAGSALAALPSLEKYDAVFWPTTTPAQAIAIAERPPLARTVLGLDGHFRRSGPHGAAIIGVAAAQMAGLGAPVQFGAYDLRIAQISGPLLHPFLPGRLPAAVDGPPLLRRRSGLRRIGFMGSQRAERGVDAIPLLAQALLAHGFEVTIQDARGQAGVGLSHPRLQVLGYAPDFAAAIDDCDAILWHGESARYRDRPSGVVWQAIACGVPIIMPSQGVPAQIALAKGSAIFFHRMTVDDAAAAAVALRARYSAAEELAHARALAWAQSEGSDALAAALLRPSLDPYAPGPLG